MKRTWIGGIAIAATAGVSFAGGIVDRATAPINGGRQQQQQQQDTGAQTKAPVATPTPCESKENAFKFVAPAGWRKSNIGGGDGKTGTLFHFTIPSDRPAPMIARKPGQAAPQPIVNFADTLSVEVEPLMDPAGKLEGVVDDAKAALKNEDPAAAQVKPVEKLKVGGVEAASVTATNIAAEEKGGQKRLLRRVVLVRDGKEFRFTLESHADTFGKAAPSVLTMLRSFQFTAPPADPATLVAVVENAEHKVKFSAPKAWKAGGASCHGAIATYMLPLDVSSRPHPKNGETVMIHGDMLAVAVNPAKAGANQTLDGAVEDLKTEVKGEMPKAEFKPVEKAKLGGADAAVLTATIPGNEKDKEPDQIHRRVVTVRDGKVYSVVLYSHANTLAKQTPAVESIASSMQFTGPEVTPAPAAPAAPVSAPTTPAAAPQPKPAADDGLN